MHEAECGARSNCVIPKPNMVGTYSSPYDICKPIKESLQNLELKNTAKNKCNLGSVSTLITLFGWPIIFCHNGVR